MRKTRPASNNGVLALVDLGERTPRDHPLRTIKAVTDYA